MSDWKSIVSAIAPTIATALGGPLAGMAVRAVSTSLLGKPEATDDELLQAVNNPEALVKLKEVDNEFKKQMADVGVNLEKIAQEDRASARSREVQIQDPTVRYLAYLYTAGYFGSLWAVWNYGMPPEMKDILIGLLGVLTAAQATIMTYYFGSSAGSAAKNFILKASK